MALFVDSSSEEEVGQPTKLSQFLKPPSPTQEKTNQPSSRNEAKSDHNKRDKHHDQAARNERASDREYDYAQTQKRLLALAEYSDQPSNDRDNHDRHSRHTEHKSSHRSKLKNSRSPGHRRH